MNPGFFYPPHSSTETSLENVEKKNGLAGLDKAIHRHVNLFEITIDIYLHNCNN